MKIDKITTRDEALQLISEAIFKNYLTVEADKIFDLLYDYIVDLDTPKQVFTCKADVMDKLHAYEALGTVEELSALKGNFDAVWDMYQSAEREAQKFRELQIPKQPIIENWNPSECPTCGEDFHEFEECNDGYYKRCCSMDRCPYCGQKLDWLKC